MKFFTRHRHWGMHAAIALVLATSVVDWTPIGRQWRNATSGVLVGALFFAVFANQFLHLRGPLCEDCIKSMPLDGDELAVRRRPLLKAHHKFYERRWNWSYIGSLVVLAALTSFVPVYGVTYNIINTLMALIMSAMWTLGLVHQRLYPWCPYCHWDGGGEREPSPDPIVPEIV